MATGDEIRYITPMDPEQIKRIREDARRRWESLTPEQREQRKKEIEARREEAKTSPRRIVRREHDEDGTITLWRADGTRLILKPGPPPNMV